MKKDFTMFQIRGAGSPQSPHSFKFSVFILCLLTFISLFEFPCANAVPIKETIKSVDQALIPNVPIPDNKESPHFYNQDVEIDAKLEKRGTTITAIETILKTVVNIETVTEIAGGNLGGVTASKTCNQVIKPVPTSVLSSSEPEMPVETTASYELITSPAPSRTFNPTSTLSTDIDITSVLTTPYPPFETDLPDEVQPKPEKPMPTVSTSATTTSELFSSMLIPIGFGEVETSSVSKSSSAKATTTATTLQSVIRVSHILSGGIISHAAATTRTDAVAAPVITGESDMEIEAYTGDQSSTSAAAGASETGPTSVYTGAAEMAPVPFRMAILTIFISFLAFCL